MLCFRAAAFPKQFLALLFFWVLGGGLLTVQPAGAADRGETERPNIVWLVSEDNSARWLRLYDPQGAPMPNIERLAADGLVFNHAFSNAPVCSTARSTIISGCYAPRIGAQYHRKQQTVPMPDDLRMFPYYLRQAGYHTTNNSKEDYNFHPAERDGVWDKSSRQATYRDRQPGQPFFHVQNFGTTHEGGLHFPAGDLDRPTETDQASVQPFAYHPDTDLFRYTYARYLDHHRKLDQQIGVFLDQLQQDGLLDDTIIFYYGDHGGVLPRGKGYAYNSGLQVPMVVHIPERWQHLAPAPAGSRIDGFVEFVDLSATALNLAGLPIPERLDGEPFLGPGVSLEQLNRRDVAFGYADRFDEKGDLVRTLRKGRFVYVRSYQPFNIDGLFNEYRYRMLAYQQWRELYRKGQLNEAQSQFFRPRPAEALFDLQNDPDEVHNLADDPEHAETLAELRAMLQRRVRSMPDLSFIPEPVFLAEGSEHPVQYGQANQERIAGLVDLADLQLASFDDARDQLGEALDADDPLRRYWALIVCSSFGRPAAPFYATAQRLAAEDPHALVRIRAAEFLALTSQAKPQDVFTDVLRQVQDETTALWILNSAALLHDSQHRYEFDFSEFAGAPWAQGKKNENQRRFRYLNKQLSP
ncbi:sulfatase-like hydrolase/transferase [Roseimaritima sediminicola]|uniref:sulfatase-like hydrolase/transferase n=1 Tax=Roseimaritima sediminicola TaxID=2662066 RepID=UPI0012984804|nr:sulfatase-like hydrolase/transferase [Roseimaritima sediminicola]